MHLESPLEQIRGSGLFKQHELWICKSPEMLKTDCIHWMGNWSKNTNSKAKKDAFKARMERAQARGGRTERLFGAIGFGLSWVQTYLELISFGLASYLLDPHSCLCFPVTISTAPLWGSFPCWQLSLGAGDSPFTLPIGSTNLAHITAWFLLKIFNHPIGCSMFPQSERTWAWKQRCELQRRNRTLTLMSWYELAPDHSWRAAILILCFHSVSALGWTIFFKAIVVIEIF